MTTMGIVLDNIDGIRLFLDYLTRHEADIQSCTNDFGDLAHVFEATMNHKARSQEQINIGSGKNDLPF